MKVILLGFGLGEFVNEGFFRSFPLKGRSVGAGRDYHVPCSGGQCRPWSPLVEAAESCLAVL